MERGTESETAIFWVETLVFFWNALLKFFELLHVLSKETQTSRELFIFFIFSTFLLVSKSMLNVGLWGVFLCISWFFQLWMASAGSSGGFHAATAASPGSSARAWGRVDWVDG